MKASRRRIVIMSVFFGIVAIGFLFFTNRTPVKARYERDTQEIVIYPGFLYSLEGYCTLDSKNVLVHSNEILKPLSNITDKEYRFCRISGDTEEQKLVISYRDALTGERADSILRVERYRELNWLGVFGDPITPFGDPISLTTLLTS